MNLELLRQKLITAARSRPPSEGVPYAFERRIMARLAPPDPGLFWTRILWRAAAPCVAVPFLIGALSVVGGNHNTNPPAETVEGTELSQHFEQALLADVGEKAEDLW